MLNVLKHHVSFLEPKLHSNLTLVLMTHSQIAHVYMARKPNLNGEMHCQPQVVYTSKTSFVSARHITTSGDAHSL